MAAFPLDEHAGEPIPDSRLQPVAGGPGHYPARETGAGQRHGLRGQGRIATFRYAFTMSGAPDHWLRYNPVRD
jgi:hypothetical protein